MDATRSKYLSINLTRFLMKIIGFWNVRTRKERLMLRINFVYMLLILCISLSNESLDLYYRRNDIYEATYTASSTIPLFIISIKAFTFLIRRKEIMWLIDQSQKHFWYKEYDVFGKNIMDDINKKAIMFICSYTVLVYGTTLIYTLYAVIESIGKDEEERIHPFTFRLVTNIPTTRTPYYEAIFVLETVSAMHSGICFCCFDNFLCVLCLHVGGQFKILQNKIEKILAHDCTEDKPVETYREFKKCILQHYFLISYVKKLECVFCFPLMCQLLISSMVLCVSGFQLCMENEFLKRLLFVIYVLGGLIQIFFITMNCDNIIEQSGAIGDAIYNCNWEETPYARFDQLRKDMTIVMLRSKCPCFLTAAKFFPISLQSFTKVLSATASYYTLLTTMDVDT